MTAIFDTIHALWIHRPYGPVSKKISKLKEALENEDYSEALGLADDPTFLELSIVMKKADRKIPATTEEKNRNRVLQQKFEMLKDVRDADDVLKNGNIIHAIALESKNAKAFHVLVGEESILSHRVKMEAVRDHAESQRGYSVEAAKANYVYALPDDQLRWDVLSETINDPHIPHHETVGMLMEYVHPLGRMMRDSQVNALKVLVSDKGFNIFEEGVAEHYGADQVDAFFRATNEMILRNESQAINVLVGSVPRLDKFIAASSVHYQTPIDYKNAIPESLIGNGAAAARLKIAELLLEKDSSVHMPDAAHLVRHVLLDDSAIHDQHFKPTQQNAVSLLKKIIFIENGDPQVAGHGTEVIKEMLVSSHNIDRTMGKKIAEEMNMDVDSLIQPQSRNLSRPKPL